MISIIDNDRKIVIYKFELHNELVSITEPNVRQFFKKNLQLGAKNENTSFQFESKSFLKATGKEFILTEK